MYIRDRLAVKLIFIFRLIFFENRLDFLVNISYFSSRFKLYISIKVIPPPERINTYRAIIIIKIFKGCQEIKFEMRGFRQVPDDGAYCPWFPVIYFKRF